MSQHVQQDERGVENLDPDMLEQIRLWNAVAARQDGAFVFFWLINGVLRPLAPGIR
jgi:hypothetical protein